MRKRGVFSKPMKKGSLSLSMNAIVIVVLAFSMLGLGLFLTRSLFGDIQNTTASVNEQIRQQILDDLRTGNKPLSFPQNRINVGFGQTEIIAFGVKNTGSIGANYCVKFEALSKDGLTDPSLLDINFYYDEDAQTLGPQETVVVPTTIDAGSQTQDLYKGKITVYNIGQENFDCSVVDTASADTAPRIHSQKSFFINIQ